MILLLHHLDNFGTIHNSGKALRNHLAISVFALQKLIPPPEEEVPSNELEPWSERVR